MTEIVPLLVCLNDLLTPTTAPDRVRAVVRPGSYHYVRLIPLGRAWQQLPDNPAFLPNHYQLGTSPLDPDPDPSMGSGGPYLLAGDEVVGQQTHDMGRFSSGLAQFVSMRVGDRRGASPVLSAA